MSGVRRILVVQTTRMGDVIQTSPLTHQLRARYPNAHIAMMVRRMGETVARHNPDLDDVIVYAEDDMYLDYKSGDSARLLRAYEAADRYIRQIRDGDFDVVYNVTHSIASAMLLRVANPRHVVGAHLSDDWQFVLRGRWTTYFFTSVHAREYNDLNLCDITRHFLDDPPADHALQFALKDEDHARIDALFTQHGIADDDFIVCMQLGASEENKRWSEANFAGLAMLLHERRDAKIFLVGIAEEAPLGATFAEHAPGIAVPRYGKTSLPELAALLSRTDLLVTNDTGTMHVAAAVECPTVLVSVGHVHYRETGPYGPGHCAVEFRRKALGRGDYVPGGLDERERVTPAHVWTAVQRCLANRCDGSVPQLEETPEIADVDLYITAFAPDGCLQFYPLIRRRAAERDVVRAAYRAMWLDYLAGDAEPEHETECLVALLGYYAPDAADTVEGWRGRIAAMFDGLAAIAERGMATTDELLRALDSRDMAQAKQLVRALAAIDEEARLYSELNPPCRPLILMARFERDNLEGSDPKRLAQTTHGIYDACATRARLMAAKIDRLAALWPQQSNPAFTTK